MKFRKFLYGSREMVLFIDESGDPALRDPANPLFVLGGCAVLGDNLHHQLREPWLQVRRSLTGSESIPVHMSELHRRDRGNRIQAALDFFATSEIRRFSVAISDKTVFEEEYLPGLPVLEIAFGSMLALSQQLLADKVPIEAITLVFEDGPLVRKFERSWPRQALTRADGVRLPVSWGVLNKGDNEPGLEVADFISHTATGYYRSGRDPESKFAARYLAIHPPNRQDISNSWEINKIERQKTSDK